MTNPVVIHTIEEHGGVRPQMTALIDQVEPRPLYCAVREAVRITQLPNDSRNRNQCQEWGQPRVPVLFASGGDVLGLAVREGNDNPMREWTDVAEIVEGSRKRVRYCEYKDDMTRMEVEKMHYLSNPNIHSLLSNKD